eukprot:jgi/Orpsp1_1/1190796/evm.model.d7180000081282.1
MVLILPQQCVEITNFFSAYGYSIEELNKDCCDGTHMVCDNSYNIISLNEGFGDMVNMDFSKFPSLPRLQSLELRGDIFDNYSLPLALFKIPTLKILKISNSVIKNIEYNINVFSNSQITEIHLNNVKLDYFPTIFHYIPNLVIFDVSNNELIKEIPINIDYYTQLKDLNLSKTGITSLPESLFSLHLEN